MKQIDKEKEERDLWPVTAQWKTSAGHAWYNCDQCQEDMPSRDWSKHTKMKNHYGTEQTGTVRCIEIFSGKFVKKTIEEY